MAQNGQLQPPRVSAAWYGGSLGSGRTPRQGLSRCEGCWASSPMLGAPQGWQWLTGTGFPAGIPRGTGFALTRSQMPSSAMVFYF